MNKRIITILIGVIAVITTLLLNLETTLTLQIVLVIIVFTLIFAFGIDYKRYQKVEDTIKKQRNITKTQEDNYKICHICHTKNKSSNTYCYKCQSSLESIVCPICKHVNQFDQKYCEECNTILQNKARH